MSYQIIKCSNCGTPQYIRKDQKTRTCPKCQKKLNCATLNVFGDADTEPEASRLVRAMKSPGEIDQRIAALKASGSINKMNIHALLGKIITELIASFPNSLPKALLQEKAQAFNIDPDFVDTVLGELNAQGLVLINQDFRPQGKHTVLKFPSVPFTYGKLQVSRPLTPDNFRKIKWTKQK